MHVAEVGPASAPPVLLLHGAGTDHTMWSPQLAALADRFRLLAPDLTAGPRPFTFERCTERLGEVLAERGIDRVHVCGLSLGAMAGVHFAATRPDLVSTLLLSGVQLRPPRVLMAAQLAVMRALPSRALGATGPQEKAEVLDLIRSLQGTDLTRCAPRITATTLVVCGARDWPNKRAARRATATIRGARLEIVPGAGHQWNTQRPDEFSALLAEFVLASRAA